MKASPYGSVWLCVLVFVFAAGCGGGPSGAASGSAALHTTQTGDAVITYFGQPKPQLLSSAGTVTVIGQAGATFSTITLQPPQKLDSTYIALGRSLNNQIGIYAASYPSGATQLLYQNGAEDFAPAISAYGTVAFGSESENGLESVRADGTGLTSINFSGITGAIDPAYAVDGTNRLAFWAPPSDLYVGPGTGGTASLVQSNNTGSYPAWNPAGTKLIYVAKVGTGSNTDLFITNVTGGTAMDITPTALQNTGVFFSPSWSADGVDVATSYQPSGGSTYESVRFNINEPTLYNVITPTGDSEEYPVFSPDGTKLAVYRYNVNGQTSGIYVEDAVGFNETLLSADPAGYPNSSNYGLSWSPFLPKETVVSATASTFYHKAASGFLLSQNGDQFGSVVAFTANTPADATIQAPTTATQSSPLGFILSADSITSVGYVNNYFGTGTDLTLTSTPSVVVTIDAGTGQVDLVAPAASAKPSTTKNADGTMTYKAPFKAVYDGRGRNIAPNGASSLTVDLKSGKLVKLAPPY